MESPVPPRVVSVALLSAALALGSVGVLWSEPSAERSVRVAAVQLLVSARDVSSLEAFREHMRAAAAPALAAGARLLVYPEYTGALAALIPYAWAVEGAATAAEALERIRGREPRLQSVRDVFLAASGYALGAMREVFGQIAAANRVTVVAGTYFARLADGSGPPALRNRALVFGPDGRVLYEQDKVYLTDFEDLLGMEPGTLGAARLFAAEGLRVGLTVCRDTFFDVWERPLAGVDLWIDIKGNGELFTTEVEERFARALPARLRASGVRAGMTVCLTGALLDFVWEGPSSVERRGAGGEVESAVRARSVRADEVLVADIRAISGSR